MSCEHDDDCECMEEVKELKQDLAEAKDSYDLLGRFFIVCCALSTAKKMPDIGIHQTCAYLTLMTRGAGEMRKEITAFVEAHKHLMNVKEDTDGNASYRTQETVSEVPAASG